MSVEAVAMVAACLSFLLVVYFNFNGLSDCDCLCV
jgi:hypothetical protein